VKVYTRSGDDGTTGLFHGGRVGKAEAGPGAYGTVDESVSALGVARAEAEPDSELWTLLLRLQRELFIVGAELATAPDNREKLRDGTTRVTAAMVAALEPIIDEVTTRFEAPREFVLPGEGRTGALLDVARTVVRRAERDAVECARTGWLEPGSQVVPYLNRLADLLWTLARWQEGAWRAARTGEVGAAGPGADGPGDA
jgi:cob(I)alamin adenosyltransferase